MAFLHIRSFQVPRPEHRLFNVANGQEQQTTGGTDDHSLLSAENPCLVRFGTGSRGSRAKACRKGEQDDVEYSL